MTKKNNISNPKLKYLSFVIFSCFVAEYAIFYLNINSFFKFTDEFFYFFLHHPVHDKQQKKKVSLITVVTKKLRKAKAPTLAEISSNNVANKPSLSDIWSSAVLLISSEDFPFAGVRASFSWRTVLYHLNYNSSFSSGDTNLL